MGATRINVSVMLKLMGERKLGTGSLAQQAGMKNDDLQKIIALESASSEQAEAIAKILGDSVLGRTKAVVAEPEKTESQVDESLVTMRAADLIEAVENGTVSKEEALAAENSREHPRSTVLAFLETA